MSETDQHATDLMALVKELAELEFRRGGLHARIEWHCRLQELAATQPEAAPAVAAAREPLALVKTPTAARRQEYRRGALQAALLAHIAAHPGQRGAVITRAMGANMESARQSLARLVRDGLVTREGGCYAVAESHPGSGLVVAKG